MKKRLSPESCRECIALLLDRKMDASTRVAASESLMYCSCQAAKDTLFQVLMDDAEWGYIREEAAGSLGTLWAESEIEYERLILIPLSYLDEVVFDFDSYGIKLDRTRLRDKAGNFEARYSQRAFMARHLQ